jgi:hypothetical protein
MVLFVVETILTVASFSLIGKIDGRKRYFKQIKYLYRFSKGFNINSVYTKESTVAIPNKTGKSIYQPDSYNYYIKILKDEVFIIISLGGYNGFFRHIDIHERVSNNYKSYNLEIKRLPSLVHTILYERCLKLLRKYDEFGIKVDDIEGSINGYVDSEFRKSERERILTKIGIK